MQFHWVGMRRTSGLSTTQLSFAMAATVLAIGSLLALLLLQSYRDRYREAEQNVINIATLLSEDIRQEIQGLDLSLRAAVDGWRDERVGSLNKSLQKMVLFDRSANRQEAGSIFIAGPDGQFLLESGSDEPRRFSVDDRGYFQSHRELPEAGLIVRARPERVERLGHS